MTARTPPSWLQAGSHPAENDRAALATLVGPNPGIVSLGDLAVSALGVPNMSVNVAPGAAFIAGTESALQGVYHGWNDAVVNLAIGASDPVNPRIDLVVARVRDTEYGDAADSFALEVVAGVPAAIPAVPATPANSLVLAQVEVDASVASIVAGKITDKRTHWRRAGQLPVNAFANIPADLAFNAGTDIAPVGFTANLVDPGGCMAGGIYTCRLGGLYLAHFGLQLQPQPADYSGFVALMLNGARVRRTFWNCLTNTAGRNTSLSVAVVGRLTCAKGDTIEAEAFNTSGNNGNIYHAGDGTFLDITYLGASGT